MCLQPLCVYSLSCVYLHLHVSTPFLASTPQYDGGVRLSTALSDLALTLSAHRRRRTYICIYLCIYQGRGAFQQS